MIRGGKGSPYEWAFIQLDVYREPARLPGFQQQKDFIINRQKRQPHEHSTQRASKRVNEKSSV